SLTDGEGVFMVKSTGLAGRISGTVNFNLPTPVGLSGTFALDINTTNQAVEEQFDVGGEPEDVQLPAGPYVRVTGDGVVLEAFGQRLTGNFAFEQSTGYGADQLPGGTGVNADSKVVRMAATDIDMIMGGGMLTMT